MVDSLVGETVETSNDEAGFFEKFRNSSFGQAIGSALKSGTANYLEQRSKELAKPETDGSQTSVQAPATSNGLGITIPSSVVDTAKTYAPLALIAVVAVLLIKKL